jgi:hypothetical protein
VSSHVGFTGICTTYNNHVVCYAICHVAGVLLLRGCRTDTAQTAICHESEE